MNKTEKSLTKEEVKDQATKHGQKLGILISALDISDEEREAWLSIIDKMSLEQIDRLIDILESKYVHQKTSNLDKKLKEEMEKIQKEYEEKIDEVDQKAIDKIKKLSKKIENHE
ncbi:MAG TPA: hypothetical protein VKO61_01890 [Candidatus Paceibacterota bacterium]|nr:hypothetical protein [Candidatus Paceibacterota bacterium]